jgi:hypothetical protein
MYVVKTEFLQTPDTCRLYDYVCPFTTGKLMRTRSEYKNIYIKYTVRVGVKGIS